MGIVEGLLYGAVIPVIGLGVRSLVWKLGFNRPREPGAEQAARQRAEAIGYRFGLWAGIAKKRTLDRVLDGLGIKWRKRSPEDIRQEPPRLLTFRGSARPDS
jgi:transposase